MKNVLPLFVAVMVLSACSTPSTQVPTDNPASGLPNPASVYCEQNGNKLEIRTAADGSQSGVCIFPDGSTCDEWAYFRDECGPASLKNATSGKTVEPTINANGGYMAPGTTEEFSDWWGVIKSTESGAQYDDYFERQDTGSAISFGIDSKDAVTKAQIETLRDSGKIVHLYGTLLSNVSDYNGSRVLVDKLEVE